MANHEIVPHSGDLEVPVEPTDVRRQDSLYLDATRPAHAGHHRQDSWVRTLLRLGFQCVGILYADLGTSPLYVYSNTFKWHGRHRKSNFDAAAPRPRLPSLVIAPMPRPAPAPPLTDDQITDKLQQLMTTGLQAARDAVPEFLGIIAPASPRRSPTPPKISPFSQTCHGWLRSIRDPPPGLTTSFSRLASPMLSFEHSAGRVADTAAMATLAAQPELSAWGLPEGAAVASAVVDEACLISHIVPTTWDDGSEARSDVAPEIDADEDATPGSAVKAMDTPKEGCHPSMERGSVVLSTGEEEGKEDEVLRQTDAVLEITTDADTLVLDQDGERAAIGDLLLLEEAQHEVDDEIDEDADVGDILSPTVQADITAIAAAQRAVASFFSQPELSLLPTPAPRAPALPLPPRRSDKLADKPQTTAMGKAQNVLYTKMGIKIQEMPLLKATKEFYKTEMPDVAVDAVGALLKLNLPFVLAADEALIAMAGAGGTELATTAIDVSA